MYKNLAISKVGEDLKKILEGWLGGHYDDLSIHETRKDAEGGMKGLTTLDDDLMEFQDKKIRITVEVLES